MCREFVEEQKRDDFAKTDAGLDLLEEREEHKLKEQYDIRVLTKINP